MSKFPIIELMSNNLDQLRRKIRILYIDPDPYDRRIAVSYLRRHYGEILTATHGEEAIEFFLKYQPGIILADFSLKTRSPQEFIAEIREHAPTPIIFYTHSREPLIQAGIDAPFIKKPQTETGLRDSIDNIIFVPAKRK
jgi:CheY-like chemotaxis protein